MQKQINEDVDKNEGNKEVSLNGRYVDRKRKERRKDKRKE